MTKINPFKAVVYNQDKIENLSEVVCPPYDIISQAKQQYFHKLNPHNLIHVLLSMDAQGKDRYAVAEQHFREWIKNKILIQDKNPAIYFYSHQYHIKGEKKIRYGFMALMRLGEKNSDVYAHEHTRLEAKEDRLKLIRHVKANLSPIFVLFSDKQKVIAYMQRRYAKEKPFLDVCDEERNVHKVWRIDAPEVVEAIQQKMQNENLFIADGHHRYEVACAYRDEMKKKSGKDSENAPYNYILTYFTNIEALGLTILPIHRLVTLEKPLDMPAFLESLNDYFFVEEIKDKTRFFFLMEKAGRTEHVLGMYKGKRYWLIRLRNIKILDRLISDKPAQYRSLDVSILNYIVLQKVLGLDVEDKDRVSFNHEAHELIDHVDAHGDCIAFFLNPTKVQQIVSVALTGNRMPPKSTFFYPKVLSGLVINKHDDI